MVTVRNGSHLERTNMDALKIGFFEEVVEDMKNGTYDFTKNGQLSVT